ncbi:TPA: hypothetical protein RUX41_004257 [Aeromonas dhakensis]|nr:hypothetical protein [Aeromonas dhakensis]
MKRHLDLPRYLRVAHWLLEQQRIVSSREVAAAFNVTPKMMSDDFAKLRKRMDLINFREQKVPCEKHGGWQYALHVFHIHPYHLDERKYPTRQTWDCGNCIDIRNTLEGGLSSSAYKFDNRVVLTWRDLLSKNWAQLRAHKKNNYFVV